MEYIANWIIDRFFTDPVEDPTLRRWYLHSHNRMLWGPFLS